MTDKPVVIITGVSSGIGLASAQLFAAKGWIVVGTVRRKDYPTELGVAGVDVQLAEMTKPGDIERVVSRTHKTYGRIDAAVASAGYALLGPLEHLSHAEISEQLAVNVVAVADLAREVLPIMRQARRGNITIISSIVGRLGIPGYTAYSASKFALEGLAESLWYETIDSGIRVKVVEPSSVKTNFWTTSLKTNHGQDAVSGRLGRMVKQGQRVHLQPERVAEVVYAAVTSDTGRLHYPVGQTRPAMWFKWLIPGPIWRRILKRFL